MTASSFFNVFVTNNLGVEGKCGRPYAQGQENRVNAQKSPIQICLEVPVSIVQH